MIYVSEVISNCSSPALGLILSAFRKILQLVQIIGPILLLISLTLNFTKLMANPDDKKLPNKIKNSVLALIIMFCVPIFVNVVMNMLDDGFSVSACWNSISVNVSNTYSDPEEVERKKILGNPDDYEKGVKKQKGTSGGAIEGSAQKIGDVVWDSSDVTKISNLTSAQLIGILNAYGGNARNFIPYAQALITAEHKYSVNVFFLLGVEALESGWITSNISRNCNNLGGVCASSAHPSNGCGSNDNCSFAQFSSAGEFIDYHASMLHTNYLTPGGSYYHGTSPSAVVTNYCPGCSDWPGSVISIANGLFSKTSTVI